MSKGMTDEVMPFFVFGAEQSARSRAARGPGRSLPAPTAVIRFLPLLLLASCSSTNIPPRSANRPAIRVCIEESDTPADVAALVPCVLSIGGERVQLPANTRCRFLRSGGAWTLAGAGASRAIPDGGCRLIGRGSAACFATGGKIYSDTLIFYPQADKLFVLNALPLEDYLLQVVPAEIGADRRAADAEAVKAQAIVARSYAWARIASPARRLFDVYDDERDQRFGGYAPPSSLIASAVRASEGSVILFAGVPAETHFHSACGGRTEAPQLVWGRAMAKSWLNGVVDAEGGAAYCCIAPSFRWTETYTRSRLEEIIRAHLASALPAGAAAAIPEGQYLLDLRIVKRLPSGRVGELQIVFGAAAAHTRFSVFGDNIRRLLRRPDGGALLRSTLFDIGIERDKDNWISAVRIKGGGSGHGVGFCQWGAIGMARQGKTAPEIIFHYFPATEIRAVY